MALGRGGPACITSRWAAASRPRRRLRGPEMVGTVYHSLDVLALSARLFALRRSHEPQKLPVHQTGTTPIVVSASDCILLGARMGLFSCFPLRHLGGFFSTCARLTGIRQRVEVPRDEGITKPRAGGPPRAVRRYPRGAGEASAAVRAGRATERRKICHLESRDPVEGRRQHRAGRYGETQPGSTASKNSGTYVRHMSGPGRPSGRPGGSSPGPLRKGAMPDQR